MGPAYCLATHLPDKPMTLSPGTARPSIHPFHFFAIAVKAADVEAPALAISFPKKGNSRGIPPTRPYSSAAATCRWCASRRRPFEAVRSVPQARFSVWRVNGNAWFGEPVPERDSTYVLTAIASQRAFLTRPCRTSQRVCTAMQAWSPGCDSMLPSWSACWHHDTERSPGDFRAGHGD